MKKRLIFFAAAVLMIATGVRAGVVDRFSLRTGFGGLYPLAGNYSDTQKLHKVVSLGAVWNAGIRYQVSDYIYIDAGYAFNWLSVKKTYRPHDYKEMKPAMNIQMWNLNATLFLSKGFVIKPYLTAGVALCPWEFSQKALWGKPWPAPANPKEDFRNTSLGINGGLGLESQLSRRFSVYLEFKYNYLYARYPEKFGTDDFNEQDFLGFHIGVVYGLGKR